MNNANIARDYVTGFYADPTLSVGHQELEDIWVSIRRYARRGQTSLCYCAEGMTPEVKSYVRWTLIDAGYVVEEGDGHTSGTFLKISWEE